MASATAIKSIPDGEYEIEELDETRYGYKLKTKLNDCYIWVYSNSYIDNYINKYVKPSGSKFSVILENGKASIKNYSTVLKLK